jgi:hypothetical protein
LRPEALVDEDRYWDDVARAVISRRTMLRGAAGASLAAFLAACSGNTVRTAISGSSPGVSPSERAAAQTRHLDLPRAVIDRLWRGYRSDRAGDVITVPKGFNFFDGGISHTTPWPYTVDIPMVWYGPGVLPVRGKVDRPVTAAGVAPTIARMVGFRGFDAPDGEPMEEALPAGGTKPLLVVVLVWDAGGNYVLNLWPKQWPHLRALLPHSTWYSNATVGSSPSSTAPIHATIGTGAFPRRHGILDNYVRFPNGALADPWSRGPSGLLIPTLADVYADEMTTDRALTGIFATLNWHLGMLGHGSEDPKRKPVAVLRERGGDVGSEGISWGLSPHTSPFYRFPSYVNDTPPIDTFFNFADVADGAKDGKWRGHDIGSLKFGFNSPARIPYQHRGLERMIREEGFGHHPAPDLLFVNYKLIDEIGHLFTASSLEMHDSIKVQDANLPHLISFLDRQVGKGKWVLLITADHGHSANPLDSGAFRIKDAAVEHGLDQHFHHPIVEKVRPGWSFLDREEMKKAGLTLAEASHFLAALTKLQASIQPGAIPAGHKDDRVIAESFPASFLARSRPPLPA